LVLDWSIFLLFFWLLLFDLFAFGVSLLVDAPAAALRSDFVPLEVLAPAPVPSGLALTSAFVFESVFGVAVVAWAAANWLNETASRPENSAGKNLRITGSPGGKKSMSRSSCKARARNAACTMRRQETPMRKLIVLALAGAASFPLGA